jgi:hypothetical protein
MLSFLERELAPHALAVGLKPIDRAIVDDVSWLEYRRGGASPILLGIYLLGGQRTIKAEIWRPERVLTARYDASVGQLADRQQTWSFVSDSDTSFLGHHVVPTIVDWLAKHLE